MVPAGYDFTDKFIIADSDYRTDTVVGKFPEQYADGSACLRAKRFTDYLKQNEGNYVSLQIMVWGLSALIIGFALINLINTLVSNAMARKHEFAMLCAIGMSGGQLQNMIIGEGLILAVKNILIMAVCGTAAGYALVWFLRENAADYLHYHFPVWYLAGYVLLVVAAPVAISAVLLRILGRKTLVERLRENGSS